jgi:hypothetical protein
VHRDGRAAASFRILDKLIYFRYVSTLLQNYILLLLYRDCGNDCGGFLFLTFEERWHTLHIGVAGRRVPGPIVILSVLYGRVLMAVRHPIVQFADIVVI